MTVYAPFAPVGRASRVLPADPSWRQSGEHWLNDVWRPFCDSFSQRELERYTEIWSLPVSGGTTTWIPRSY